MAKSVRKSYPSFYTQSESESSSDDETFSKWLLAKAKTQKEKQKSVSKHKRSSRHSARLAEPVAKVTDSPSKDPQITVSQGKSAFTVSEVKGRKTDSLRKRGSSIGFSLYQLEKTGVEVDEHSVDSKFDAWVNEKFGSSEDAESQVRRRRSKRRASTKQRGRSSQPKSALKQTSTPAVSKGMTPFEGTSHSEVDLVTGGEDDEGVEEKEVDSLIVGTEETSESEVTNVTGSGRRTRSSTQRSKYKFASNSDEDETDQGMPLTLQSSSSRLPLTEDSILLDSVRAEEQSTIQSGPTTGSPLSGDKTLVIPQGSTSEGDHVSTKRHSKRATLSSRREYETRSKRATAIKATAALRKSSNRTKELDLEVALFSDEHDVNEESMNTIRRGLHFTTMASDLEEEEEEEELRPSRTKKTTTKKRKRRRRVTMPKPKSTRKSPSKNTVSSKKRVKKDSVKSKSSTTETSVSGPFPPQTESVEQLDGSDTTLYTSSTHIGLTPQPKSTKNGKYSLRRTTGRKRVTDAEASNLDTITVSPSAIIDPKMNPKVVIPKFVNSESQILGKLESMRNSALTIIADITEDGAAEVDSGSVGQSSRPDSPSSIVSGCNHVEISLYSSRRQEQPLTSNNETSGSYGTEVQVSSVLPQKRGIKKHQPAKHPSKKSQTPSTPASDSSLDDTTYNINEDIQGEELSEDSSEDAEEEEEEEEELSGINTPLEPKDHRLDCFTPVQKDIGLNQSQVIKSMGGNKYHMKPLKGRTGVTPGKRRSKRTRVPRLEQNHQYIYQVDQNLIQTVIGVGEPINKKEPQKAKRRAVGRPAGRQSFSKQFLEMMFSENTEEPCDLSLTEGDQIIDIEFSRHLSSCKKKLSDGSTASKEDSLIIVPMFASETCSVGSLILRPGCDKPVQNTQGSNLVFILLCGSLEVNMQENKLPVKAISRFWIPENINYGFHNTGTEPASLLYVRDKINS